MPDMAGIDHIKRAMAHDHLFLTWPWTDNRAKLLHRLDLVANLTFARLIHFLFPFGRQHDKPCSCSFGDGFRIPQGSVPPIFNIIENTLHAFFKSYPLRPAQLRLYLGNVRPCTIGLAGSLGNVHDGSAEQLNQPIDCLGIARPQVVDLPHPIGLGRRVERARDIGDIQKIARLRAISPDSEWLSFQLLLEKNTEHRAVGTRCSRTCTVGVKNADRIYRQAVDMTPVKTGLLPLILRQGIRILWIDSVVLASRNTGKTVARR